MISICISTSYMTRLISLSHHQHRATQTCYPTESTSHKKQHLCPPHVLEPRICITEPGWKWRSVRPIPPRSLSYQWSGRVENGRIYFGFWSFFEVTQIEHLCPNWTGLQSLRFALSSLGKTWLETFIFSFYFVGFELPCFFYIYFFPLIIWPWGRMISTTGKWWRVYRWPCRWATPEKNSISYEIQSLHMALRDWWLSLSPADQLGSASDSCNVKSSFVFLAHTPCLDSNSGIVSHGHTHRLGAWRLRNPVAGGLDSYYLFMVSGSIMGVLHSGHNDGTAVQRHARGWSVFDRGHCRDSRGALAFDMLPRFAVAAKSFVLCVCVCVCVFQ